MALVHLVIRARVTQDAQTSTVCSCFLFARVCVLCSCSCAECLSNNGGCDPVTTCTNTAGSRTCSNCPSPAYTGSSVGGCVAVNLCLTNNGSFCVCVGLFAFAVSFRLFHSLFVQVVVTLWRCVHQQRAVVSAETVHQVTRAQATHNATTSTNAHKHPHLVMCPCLHAPTSLASSRVRSVLLATQAVGTRNALKTMCA